MRFSTSHAYGSLLGHTIAEQISRVFANNLPRLYKKVHAQMKMSDNQVHTCRMMMSNVVWAVRITHTEHAHTEHAHTEHAHTEHAHT
jgi:hypothetical protein